MMAGLQQRTTFDFDQDIWADEDGDLYVKDGDDFVPFDPPSDWYGGSDFRHDAGYA